MQILNLQTVGKKACIVLKFLLLISFAVNSQVFYSTTENGVTDTINSWPGLGNITKFDVASNTLTSEFEFKFDFSLPNQMMRSSNGKFYGTASGGGANNYGVIFLFDPATSQYSIVKSFSSPDGAIVKGALIEDFNGKLYGVTNAGGSNNHGVIFSFDPVSLDYAVLKHFDDNTGTPNNGGLFLASNGKMYGMTSTGGKFNDGIIFSFDPANSRYTKLKDFSGAEGGRPTGRLAQGPDGKLYGLTGWVGPEKWGSLFSFDPITLAYTKIRDFNVFSGESLVLASNGKLYGTTSVSSNNSNSRIFSFDPVSSVYNTYLTNVAIQSESLLEFNGKLYGTGGRGTSTEVIFSFDLAANIYKRLDAFEYTITGAYPTGTLTAGFEGKLYGVTWEGANGLGSIFSLNTVSGDLQTEISIGYLNGKYPTGELMKAADGKLYGTTRGGGNKGYGVIFSFDPTSSTYSKLKDFNNTDGIAPVGKLVEAEDGKLYGMFREGGKSIYSEGVLYSFDPLTKTYTKLVDFQGTKGSRPFGSLTKASGGILYGMTSSGGSDYKGVIFSFNTRSSAYTIMKSFDGLNGSTPLGSLVLGEKGLLYGTTASGGPKNLGGIFSFNPSTLTYRFLSSPDPKYGRNPKGDLLQASNGKLYGFAEYGENEKGLIFSIDPFSLSYKTIKLHGGAEYFTQGRLIQASDGLLYGTTYYGGTYQKGTLFSINTRSFVLSKLQDFTGLNGSNPTSLVEYSSLKSPNLVSKIILQPTDLKGELISIKATPNPSAGEFTLTLQSNSNEEVEIAVWDLVGRKVYQKKGGPAGTFRFGSMFTKGTYVVRVTQGKSTKTIRLIKASNSNNR